jgi:hypothetical protein
MEDKKNIIRMDSDTDSEDKSEGGGIYPYDPAYSDIEISDMPFSVFEYLRQLDKGKIEIQPDFQRNQVWTNIQKSRFIESVLLNFPLPPIYLNETKNSTYIVIEGLQRSITLKEFYHGSFELEGLEALPKYSGCRFKDLSEALQSKFENKKLTIFVLKPSTPMVVIYDLFNRIVSDKRMKDREVVLRYIAFRWFNYKDEYSGNMSDYIESVMEKINKMEDAEIQKIEVDFERVMQQSFFIRENKNFRIPTKSTKGTINTAVLETVCNYLSYKDDGFIKKK